MSRFARFMRQNKIDKGVTTYAPTKSILDEDGNPVKFTIRAITTREDNEIRDKCTDFVPVAGKPNVYNPKVNTSKYICKMICACVVEPDLHDKELQDSYGVMTPEDLILEMIDNPTEYDEFASFVRNFSGTVTLEDTIEEAKN